MCKMKAIEFTIPVDTPIRQRAEAARQVADKLCPEGWKPDEYYGSIESFEEKDGKLHTSTIIRKLKEKIIVVVE